MPILNGKIFDFIQVQETNSKMYAFNRKYFKNAGI